MRILFAFYAPTPETAAGYARIAACAPPGIEVRCFNLDLRFSKSKLNWEQLDPLWRKKDPGLLAMYERLAAAAADCDVLIAYNGRNIHPAFAATLDTFNVFACFDDPESSEKLSFPVAPAFDAVFYGNIASSAQYESWGCGRRAFLPIFVDPGKIPQAQDADQVLTSPRDNDIVLVCGRNSKRQQRLDRLINAFPEAKAYGKNWNRGWIEEAQLRELYLNSRIGWNVHNSTGPINVRLFMLAAYGILPICDNKTGLGMLFRLGREAIGADTIPDMVDLTRYYLAHEEERQAIATAAYRRFWMDYHPEAVWKRIAAQVQEWNPGLARPPRTTRATTPATRGLKEKTQRLKAKVLTMMARQNDTGGVESSAWYDDRLYLGIKLPPDGKGMTRHYKRPRPLGDQLDFGSNAHRLARLWAMTSLLGKESSLLCRGTDAYVFSRLASVDPSRTIHCACAPKTGHYFPVDPPQYDNLSCYEHPDYNEAYELVVLTDTLPGPDSLAQRIAEHAASTARLLFSFRLEAAQGRVPGKLVQSLVGYCGTLELYYMPDIYVPWLEPATCNTRSRLLLGSCTPAR